MGHEKVICKVCDKVIRQCRCLEGHNNTKYEICDDCKEV